LNTDVWGVHQAGYCGIQMDMVACSIFDSEHIAVVCMYIDMTQVHMRVEVSMQTCYVLTAQYDLPSFLIGEVVQSVLTAVAPEWVSEVALLAGHSGRHSFLHI
jgi:hypothetical protein